MKEDVVAFGNNQSLVGVVTTPNDNPISDSDVGIIFLNSGLLHHVGPNRLYVSMARSFAKSGLISLRFDLSGIGDSAADISFSSYQEKTHQEIRLAMQHQTNKFNLSKFILIGGCSGAMSAVRTAALENNVAGIVPINVQSLVTVRHQLRMYIANFRKIGDLFKGKINLVQHFKYIFGKDNKPSPSLRNEELAYITNEDVENLIKRKVPSLFICSQWDKSLDVMYTLLKNNRTENIDNATLSTYVLWNSTHDLFDLHPSHPVFNYINEWIEKEVTKRANTSRIPRQVESYQLLSLTKNIGGKKIISV